MATVPAPRKLFDRLYALLARGFPRLSTLGHPQSYFKAIQWKENGAMKRKNRLIYILAVLTLSLVGTVAPAATIVVLQTFDFPGGATATMPEKISDQGDLIGTVIDVNGVEHGFIYKYRLGKFSSPFSEPNDTGGITRGRGINKRRTSCGEYLNASDGTFHGYLLFHPDFVEFDVTGALDTIPLGINNRGDFVGTVIFSDGPQLAFGSVNGRVTTFAVPDATATFAYQLNADNQIIGYYVDTNGIPHGYTRDRAGNLTFPIDVADSTGTMLFGNNDSNWGVGSYTNASTSGAHGLYFITPDDIQTFNYLGSTSTSLTGINREGIACGYYIDAAGITHGFVAQVRQ